MNKTVRLFHYVIVVHRGGRGSSDILQTDSFFVVCLV